MQSTNPQLELESLVGALNIAVANYFGLAESEESRTQMLAVLRKTIGNFTREAKPLLPLAIRNNERSGCPPGWQPCPDGSCIPPDEKCPPVD